MKNRERLSHVSSDASIESPRTLFDHIHACVLEGRFALQQVLPLVTSNTARVLKLDRQGKLEPRRDADVIVLERDSLEIVEMIARGKRTVRGGRTVVAEKFLEGSNRMIALRGSGARRFKPQG